MSRTCIGGLVIVGHSQMVQEEKKENRSIWSSMESFFRSPRRAIRYSRHPIFHSRHEMSPAPSHEVSWGTVSPWMRYSSFFPEVRETQRQAVLRVSLLSHSICVHRDLLCPKMKSLI